MSSIAWPLENTAKTFGSLPAIVSGEKVISFRQYEDMAASMASGLAEKGLKSGQRVAIVANNCWQYVVLLQAMFRLGIVACPISPRFPRDAILSILQKIHCSTVIAPADRLSAILPTNILRIGLGDLFQCDVVPSHKVITGFAAKVRLDGDATIILTSGTSGAPKAVVHSFGNHYFNALGSNENIAMQPGDRWLLSLPLYHVGGIGIVFRMMLAGGTVVIPEGKEAIGVCLARYGVTHLSLVATQLYRLLKQGLDAGVVKCLKAVLVGGGPVPVSIISQACEAGMPLYTTYGLTEMASQVTTTEPKVRRKRLLTSGKILAYRSLKIHDGEILVKGKTLFKGYVEGSKTVLPLDDEGWFRTGDLGGMDDRGYVMLLGRKDNMFISGGENICPEEIERRLCMLPHISEAVVVPIEDQEFGFRPVAFVKMEQGKAMDPEVFMSNLERHLPRFKIPVAFYAWPTGADKGGIKPDRPYLKRLAAKEGQKNQ